jgi:hypothetical protein
MYVKGCGRIYFQPFPGTLSRTLNSPWHPRFGAPHFPIRRRFGQCYPRAMSVDEINKAIEELSPEDRAKLRARWDEIFADEWDRQIEADIKSGAFDTLAEKAMAEHNAGLSRKL